MVTQNFTTELQNVNLLNIVPDPNQPRKFFDQEAQDELTESIRSNGVLQPILIRPTKNKDQYMIVVGERRYRSSVALNKEIPERNTIPAVIKTISDEETLELQLIENLQRKDVHPMEEAVSFASLHSFKKWTVAEIAGRIGKPEYFIRQRLKLNSLTQSFQTAFFHNNITYKIALKIATMPVEQQEDFFNEKMASKTLERNKIVEIDAYDFVKYNGILSEAKFDLTDESLLPEMGACTDCIFNTSCAQLFPEEIEKARCTNIGCFKNKQAIDFARKLTIAKEDPLIFLANRNNGSALCKQLKKEGHQFLEPYNDFEVVHKPELISWDEFYEDHYDEDEEMETGAKEYFIELKNEFAKEEAEYQKELEEYNKKIASGKLHKVFWVENFSSTGTFDYVKLKSKAKAGAAADPDAPVDVKEEIERLKGKELRNKELDAEKVHAKIIHALADAPVLMAPGKSDLSDDTTLFTDLFKKLIAFFFIDHSPLAHDKKFLNKLGLKELPYFSSNRKYVNEYFATLDELTLVELEFLITKIIFESYKAHLPFRTGGHAIALIAERYLPKENIAAFVNTQTEVATKREAKVNARLEELQKQLPSKKKKAKATTE